MCENTKFGIKIFEVDSVSDIPNIVCIETST